MAFTGEQTWTLLVDFQWGSDQGDNMSIPPRGSGYVREVPKLFAEDSGELRLECFEWWYNTSTYAEMDFGSGATVKLYVKEADADDTPLNIGTGATSKNASYGDTAYSVVTVGWDADALTTYYANKTCLFYVEVTSASDQRTWYQRVEVVDPTGDTEATTLETSTFPISTTSISSDTTISAYPGKHVVFVDASGGTVAVTLPSAAAYTQQEVVIVPTDNTNDITVVGTLNGWVGPATSSAGEFNALHLWSDGSAWYNMNHTTVIR